MINISFESDAIHNTCLDLHQAEKQYGSVHAAALVTFISDAVAFENVGELLDYIGTDMQILLDDSLSVAIGSDYRADLVVAGKRFSRHANGRVDWASVTRLKVVQILRAL